MQSDPPSRTATRKKHNYSRFYFDQIWSVDLSWIPGGICVRVMKSPAALEPIIDLSSRAPDSQGMSWRTQIKEVALSAILLRPQDDYYAAPCRLSAILQMVLKKGRRMGQPHETANYSWSGNSHLLKITYIKKRGILRRLVAMKMFKKSQTGAWVIFWKVRQANIYYFIKHMSPKELLGMNARKTR